MLATFPRFRTLEQEHGSLVRGMWKTKRPERQPGETPRSAFYSLRGGLRELVDALSLRIPREAIWTRLAVRSVTRDDEGYTLALDRGELLHAERVIVAAPGPRIAPALEPVAPAAARALAAIPFASTATVLLGYRREDVGHLLEGYGLVVAARERLRTTALSFVSTKFPFRAPEGHVLLRGFLGGVRDGAVLGLSDEELVETVREGDEAAARPARPARDDARLPLARGHAAARGRPPRADGRRRGGAPARSLPERRGRAQHRHPRLDRRRDERGARRRGRAAVRRLSAALAPAPCCRQARRRRGAARATRAARGTHAGRAAEGNGVAASVVYIQVYRSPADWSTPWRQEQVSAVSGSGFCIEGGRILTNAHVIADARQILVRRPDQANPYVATVETAGDDCDLAVLRVADPAFAAGLRPIPFGAVPRAGTRVLTYGFPLGGQDVSSTAGIVSRIESRPYVHSGADSHLVVQTDAAINPGNSGGPVVQDGRVVGVAFQGYPGAENMGFFIPIPIVRHFLDNLKDGRYDGFPDSGLDTMPLLSPALRRERALPKARSGVVVERVAPGGSFDGVLRPGDVLLSIQGQADRGRRHDPARRGARHLRARGRHAAGRPAGAPHGLARRQGSAARRRPPAGSRATTASAIATASRPGTWSTPASSSWISSSSC